MMGTRISTKDLLSSRSGLAGFVVLWLILVVLASKVWFFITGDIRAVVAAVPDDTAYFYKIAWNVVQGKGLTFDGINPTNGFQPLWLYALLPLAWLMRSASPEDYFRAALVYQALIVLSAGVVLFFALRRVSPLGATLIAVAIFYFLSRSYFTNGMETGVLLLSAALVLLYALRYRVFFENNPKVALGFGGLLGVLLLARLDTIFVVGIIYLFVLGRIWSLWRRGENPSATVKDAVWSLVALIVVTLPYFAYNKLAFGALMPISGTLKNSFPYIVQPEFGLGRFGLRDLALVGTALAFCLWFLFYLRNRLHVVSSERKLLMIATLIGSLSVLAHYLNTALFMKWAVFSWHFAFYYLNFCLIVASGLTYFLERYPRFVKVASVGAVCVVFLASGYIFVRTSKYYGHSGWHSVSYEAAVWARNNTHPDAIFAMKDAGIFGLFSMRRVINLDGLVNNMEYQEALHRKQLNAYFAQKGVQYLVQHAMWDIPEHNRLMLTGDYEFIERSYRSNKYDTVSDPIRLYKRDEVYRKVFYEKAINTDTVFAIWRLRPSGLEAQR